MTLFGVAGCMGLVLVGFGLHDSIMVVGDKQFSELTHYQAVVSINSGENGLMEKLTQTLAEKEPDVVSLATYEKNVELQSDSAIQNAVLEVPQVTDNIARFFTYRIRETQETLEYPSSGALISEKTAAQLNVKVGDSIQIKNGDIETVSVQIVGIYENYIGHYLFISSQTYQNLYGSLPEFNELLLCYPDNSEEFENKLGNYLLQKNGVQAVNFVSEMVEWADDTLSSLDSIVYIVLASAALLAFVVLYNLNSINIAERQRELATLKVLGFYDTEVAAYVYKENFLLTGIGICFGIVAGIFLHQYVIESIEVDIIMFGRAISPISFILGALLTFTFAVIINLAMYGSLKKIDMIKSLKSVE